MTSEPNKFKEAETWSNTLRNRIALVAVTLKRGVNSRVTVATPDMTLFSYLDRGVQVRKEVRDYVFNVADYHVGTGQLEPEEGDIIIEVVGSTTFTYEVLPTNNEPVFKPGGAYRTGYIVHTKLIDEVTV